MIIPVCKRDNRLSWENQRASILVIIASASLRKLFSANYHVLDKGVYVGLKSVSNVVRSTVSIFPWTHKICLHQFKIAFASVDCTAFWSCQPVSIEPDKLISFIQPFYSSSHSRAGVPADLSDRITTGRDVFQGCPSSSACNFVITVIMKIFLS